MSGYGKTKFWLFVLLLWSFSWFAAEFWNANSTARMFCTIALLESGDPSIDRFHEHTIDKSYARGRYYSNKAPGMSLMALFPVGLSKAAASVVGLDLEILQADGNLNQASYGGLTLLATVCTVAFPSALVCVLVFGSLAHLTGDRRAALTGVLLTWLGTPMWGWSAVFFSHAVAGAALILGFHFLLRIQTAEEAGKRTMLSALAAFALSWAVVIEYTAPPAALAIFLWALWKFRKDPYQKRHVAAGLGAAALAFIPLLLYNRICFGGWFSTSYSHVVGFEGSKEGFLGVTYPKLHVLWEILFGLGPGLLLISPIVLLAPYGWYRMWSACRAEAILTLSIFVYYILLNASYHYWGGAWVIGPRHATAGLPFLALPLAYAARDLQGKSRFFLYLLGSLSVVLSLVCACIGMTPPPVDSVPIYNMIIKPFLSGDFVTPLGVFLGLGGYALLSIYLALAIPLAIVLRRSVVTVSPDHSV